MSGDKSRVNTILLGVTIALLAVTIALVTAFYISKNDGRHSSKKKPLMWEPLPTSNAFADVSDFNSTFHGGSGNATNNILNPAKAIIADNTSLTPLPTAKSDINSVEFPVASAEDLANLMPGSGVVLEISPEQNQLTGSVRKALQPEWLKSSAPIVSYKLYDSVIAARSAEFDPNLVKHLQTIHDILKPGGSYFVVLPDHRYNASHFMQPSSLAQVLKAYVDNKTSVSPETVFENNVLRTHNNAVRHWRGDHDDVSEENRAKRISESVKALQHPIGYNPAHAAQAWVFTPHTFSQICKDLYDAGHSKLELQQLFVTPRNKNEFYAILTKPAVKRY
jgi:hypothetical protein